MSALFLLLSLPIFAGESASNSKALPVLTKVKQIGELSPEAAALGYPVHIGGVVTYYDPVGPNLFVQDSTAGIWVETPRGLKSPPIVGELLDLQGVVAQGFASYIAKPHWKIIGQAPMPKPRQVTYADIATSSDDSQWVEMQGIIRSFVKEAEDNVLVIDVATAGGVFKARIPAYDHPFPMELVDANVRFLGVCGTAFNRMGQLVGVHLFVPSIQDLTVIDPAPTEPFAVQTVPISSLGRFSAKGWALHRVKVQGFATAVMPGRGLYIKDETGGVFVASQDGGMVKTGDYVLPGDEVEAVGFPVTGEYTPVLRSAQFKPTRRRQVVAPVKVSPKEALFGKYDAQLVQIEGVLQSEKTDSKGEPVLVLESENLTFNAISEPAHSQVRWPFLLNGSKLRLTGICSIKVDENGNPSEFRILLRSPADIAVIGRAPFFTSGRLLASLAVLAAVVAIVLAWVAVLRRRVRKQTAIIRQQIEKSRSLIDNSPYGIASLDQHRKLLDVNPAFRQIVGITAQDVAFGLSLTDVLRFSDDAEAEFERAVKAGGTFQHLEVTCSRRDSSQVTLRISGRVVHDEAAGENALEIITEDITSKRQLEQQLLQVYKLEAVGRLAGGIAHDFNNLLTVIKGYASILSESLDAGTAEAHKLHAIMESANRAASLTHQLLAYSRKQVLEPKVLEIDPLIHNLEKMLRRLIREDIEFRTELHSDGAKVKVDPHQLEQVLINLAVNGRDAMSSGGRLTIQTQRFRLDATKDLHCEITPGTYVMISVTDTGVGMDTEMQQHIFEPFFTTKEMGKGTGLGLSMVYGIVKQSGGSISVDSAPGKGTTFRIYLPVLQQAVTVHLPKAPEPAPPKGKGTVLVVEDEDEVRRLLSETLKRLGYSTIQASNGEEALDLATSTLELDLVVSDMIMPKMGGAEFREKLLGVRPELPVLLISGYSDVLPEQDEFFNAATQFLQKPFSPKTLGNKVGEMLDSREIARVQ